MLKKKHYQKILIPLSLFVLSACAPSQSGSDQQQSGQTAQTSSTATTTTATTYKIADFKLKSLKVSAKKAELGKRLFFDKRLSGDASISCSSCHTPENGFSDGKDLSDAYTGLKGFRNTPTLINTAHKKTWFHDGRMGTNLNDVTRDQITETIWMNMDMRIMQERIKQDPVYVKMFKDAGYGEPSNGSVRKAIPEYLKTLVSKNAPFDKGTMSADAKKGWSLFTGKANCVACHSGSTFSDGQPHKIQVPENTKIYKNAKRSAMFVAFNMFMGNENFMNLRQDPGAHVREHRVNKKDFSAFMTPTLRELKYTAPYMHNGMAPTLTDAIKMHLKGGTDPKLKTVQLSVEEIKQLVSFLESLSGDQLTGSKYVWNKAIDYRYPVIKNWENTKN
ncbi:MAG: cytochrome c peroxidase [bacterium]|jgi:cytochrome c peroxidase